MIYALMSYKSWTSVIQKIMPRPIDIRNPGFCSIELRVAYTKANRK